MKNPAIAAVVNPPRVPRSGAAEPAARVGRATDIRATLQEEIESGLLFPGTVLDETVLAERFGVSRTPVREALQQLAARDLVQIEPHVGTHVARLSVAEVRAMLEYLSEMEAVCAKLAARRVDAALRDSLQAALAQGREAIARGGEGFLLANAAFHDAIYEGCYSGQLAAQIRKTRRLLRRYRAQEFTSLTRTRQSQADHEQIVAAILAGDEGAAAQAMLDHLPSGTSGFSEFLAKVPAHFFDTGSAQPMRN
jgi:DNA-binding GntR family transcriptional regulator